MSRYSKFSLCAVLFWLVASGWSVAFARSAVAARPVPVNIFGDGNPLNGVEDRREPVLAKSADDGNTNDRDLNAGTVTCDGKFRGTAMVVDARESVADFSGVILLSAAHVFYDLHKKRLFRRCEFHFMGWQSNNGYRARIDLKNVRMGDFDPGQATGQVGFGEGDWAFLYLRKAWKNYKPEQSLPLRQFEFAQGELFQQYGGEFRLVAFDSSAGVIAESKNCTVLESGRNDLGGGAWRGQLLDDCDSADGASGGGIIAVLNHQRYLIGVRNGSHWSELVYPVERYPAGPPEGAVWDRRFNTNFGRAIDSHLLQELETFIQSYQ